MQGNHLEADTGALTFKIVGCFYGDKTFPGLNNLLAQAERHPMAYNRMKKEYEQITIAFIRKDLKGYRFNTKVTIDYDFVEPNKGQKRDFDNIAAASRKIINDALVKSQTIKDDSPKYLLYGSNSFHYTDGEPYIEVRITPVLD